MAEIINSPCVNVCALNTDDICVGCYRSAKEISYWSVMSSEEKLLVLKACGERSKPFKL